jgi:subtilisin family serine protease
LIPDDLPAWSLDARATEPPVLPSAWPGTLDRVWAFGDGRGDGVRVAIIDSGVDAGHPALAGRLEWAVQVEVDGGGAASIVEDHLGDVSGHGTACAGIIRALAPACELTSVRVLGADLTGGGDALVAGLRWAVREGHHVVNLSLSTTKARFAELLRELTDEAYFGGCMLVASAHNMPVASWPWRFAPVLSVASHAGTDSEEFFYNPRPPVEFHARGMDVEVAWSGGTTIRASGNSFATPHMTGMATRVLGAHPGLRPFEVKTALRLSADNVRRSRDAS